MIDTSSTNKLIKELSEKIDRFQSNVNTRFEKSDKRFEKVEMSLDFMRMDIKNVEKHAEEIDKRNEKRYDKVMTHLDGIAGKYKKIDEEQTILSSHSTKHTDRIEKLEKKVFGTVQI